MPNFKYVTSLQILKFEVIYTTRDIEMKMRLILGQENLWELW